MPEYNVQTLPSESWRMAKKKFAVLMATLSEVYPMSWTKEKMEIYARALSDIPIEILEQGIMKIIQTRKTTGTPVVPGEIRAACLGTASERSQAALEALEKAMFKYGGYDSVLFDDPAIPRAVEAIGGWEEICSLPGSEWKWKRKEFREIYETVVDNPGMSPTKMIGRIERECITGGYVDDVPPTKKIITAAQTLKKLTKGDENDTV